MLTLARLLFGWSVDDVDALLHFMRARGMFDFPGAKRRRLHPPGGTDASDTVEAPATRDPAVDGTAHTFAFRRTTHMGVDDCMGVDVFDSNGRLLHHTKLSQCLGICAFATGGQDHVCAAIKEFIQNAQDAVCDDCNIQVVGQLGDGFASALAVLEAHGVRTTVSIEPAPKRALSFHLKVEEHQMAITNVTSKFFSLSSIVSGHTSKRTERVASPASSVYEVVKRYYRTERANDEDDDVVRTLTHINLDFGAIPIPSIERIYFFADSRSLTDLVLSDDVHIQYKLGAKGELRIFEAGLYLEHRAFADHDAPSIDLNITLRGRRVSSTRDRKFAGFDAIGECAIKTSDAASLVQAVFTRTNILNLSPLLLELMSWLARLTPIPWPSDVVPLRRTLRDASIVRRVLPPSMVSVVIDDANICAAFDVASVYEKICDAATPSQHLERVARTCVERVGGHLPSAVRILDLSGDDLEKLVEVLPSSTIGYDTATRTFCLKNALFVSRDFLSPNVPTALMVHRFFMLYDVFANVFDMTSVDAARIYTASTRCTVSPTHCLREDDYFIPHIPEVIGSSIEFVPAGRPIYSEWASRLHPEVLIKYEHRLKRLAEPCRDAGIATPSCDRIQTIPELVTELTHRKYGECTLNDINDRTAPIQCIARSTLAVLVLRHLGIDAKYLRNASHAMILVETVDNLRIVVECCTHLFSTSPTTRETRDDLMIKVVNDAILTVGRDELLRFLEKIAKEGGAAQDGAAVTRTVLMSQ